MQIANTKRRLVGGINALALALMGVMATSGIALADEVGPDQPNHPNVGSLTIVKHEGASGAAGNGTKDDSITSPVLGGVEFTLWQIGVVGNDGTCAALDLTDPDAWDKVPTSGYPAELPAGTTAGDLCAIEPNNGNVKVTNDDGELKFDELDLGLYYVEETSASGAYKFVDGEKVAVSVTSKAAPFYVTIPLPNENDWLYDVYAYPKNQVTEGPSKVINEDKDQSGYKVGDTVKYTISQTVPALKAGDDKYTSAKIWETFSSGMVFGETIGSVQVNGNDVDYTQTPSDAAGAVSVEWALGPDALANLKEGDVITVTFTGKVTEVTESGSIENPMSENPGEPGYGSEFNGDKTPTPPVTPPNPITYWGQLNVKKVDQDKQTLAGAEFTVTLPGTDGLCPATPGTAVSTGVAGNDGVVLWDYTVPASAPLGLWIANTNDEDKADPSDKSKDYCLYETKAPAGYTAIAEPMLVTIKPGVDNVLELDVENIQKDGPDLPLTGANGTMLMTLGGIALAALAGGVYMVNRRKVSAE